ncbi:MAG: hypothetical protein ABG776_01395 [Cyanobacteria bacterium J06555_13]
MLESYEAVYENGQLKWLNEQPVVDSARVIVTVLEDLALNAVDTAAHSAKRRFPPDAIAGKGKTLGDIVSPIVPEEDWECLK